MPKFFSDLVNAAETGKKSAIRALQAWQYLIAKASNRQLVRYTELAEMMGYTDSRPLPKILGCIMCYCSQQNLPPLTIIVVSKEGIPGEGFTDAKPEEFHRKREAVFDFNWYDVFPPTVEELHQAFFGDK